MRRRPPRTTQTSSSAASDGYKSQVQWLKAGSDASDTREEAHVQMGLAREATRLGGRDELSRLMAGATNTLVIGIVTVLIALGVGVPLGGLAALYRGRLEDATMRLSDVLLAFPAILLAILFAAVFQPSRFTAMAAIGIALVPVFARVVRGRTSLGSSGVGLCSMRAFSRSVRRRLSCSSLAASSSLGVDLDRRRHQVGETRGKVARNRRGLPVPGEKEMSSVAPEWLLACVPADSRQLASSSAHPHYLTDSAGEAYELSRARPLSGAPFARATQASAASGMPCCPRKRLSWAACSCT